MKLGQAKALALKDIDIEAMEELIVLENVEKGVEHDRRSNDSEKCESIRSSQDYWEDINMNYGADDIKSKFKELAAQRKKLINAAMVNDKEEGNENTEHNAASIKMKKREMISAFEVEKKIKSLEKVHTYEMNNVKALARHHAMEFLKA